MITEQQEVKFWNWFKNKMKHEKIDFQRIENTTGGGVPDVNACHLGSEVWIELKVYVKGNVVLRKEQYAWLLRRARHDGNVMVMAWDPGAENVEIFLPQFKVRRWGNTGKYVALTQLPDYVYKKKTDNSIYIKAIFDI